MIAEEVFEELPPHEPAWKALEKISAFRKGLLASGYEPVPALGKAVNIVAWTNIKITPALVDTWARERPDELNTGIRTKWMPTVDIDITDREVAEEVEALLQSDIENSAVRIGMPPKRAIPFRTDTLFDKMVVKFKSAAGDLQKVEVLCNGQQVIVRGFHPSGLPYRWHGGEPGPELRREDLPVLTQEKAAAFLSAAAAIMRAHGWTEDKPDRKTNGSGQAHESANGKSRAGVRERAYAEAALEGCADELARTSEGSRNETLYKKAFRIGTMVARHWVTRTDAERVLFDAAAACGLVNDDGEAQTRKTIASGLDGGQAAPHPDLENDASEEPEAEEFEAADGEAEVRNHLGEWDAGDDTELPPPRGGLLGNIFCRTFLSSVLGDGGTGKTALRYAQLLSCATSRSLTGDYVFTRSRVLIVSLEDDAHELRRRILAARLHHGIDADELKGWLFLAAPGGKAGKLMTQDKRGRVSRGALAELLEAVVSERKIDIISIDPFVKSHSVEENSNSAIDDVVQVLTDMAAKHQIAVDVLHHTSKGPADPGNAARGRGASAMNNGGRLVYTLSTMSPDEAKAFGVAEDQRKQFIRMDSAKVNITRALGAAKWFRLVNVPIGNGSGNYPNGDEVQTVERWQPPDTWGDLPLDLLNRILTAIDAGLPDGNRYSDAPNVASERAAWKVVQEHAPRKTEEQCREIIKTWVRTALLVPEDYENPATRKMVRGLKVDPKKRPG